MNRSKEIDAYIEKADPDRHGALNELRKTITEHIPNGFEERINYGIPSYVVPHQLYPDGYHCDPKLPLPFVSFASQKRFIALYHMGVYADSEVLDWFVDEYSKRCAHKLDMGKSCIRFKKINEIPYDLIAELMTKMDTSKWISIYEASIKR